MSGDTASPHSATDLARQLEIYLAWAVRHQWTTGQSLLQNAPGAASLWMVESGVLEVALNDSRWQASAGEFFVWPAYWPRHISCRENATWVTLGLQARLYGRIDIFDLLKPPRTRQADQETANRWSSLAGLLIETKTDVSGEASILRDGLCRTLIALCWRIFEEDDLATALHKTIPSWLRKTLDYAAANPNATVAELGDQAGFSPTQFRRAFSQHMNHSPRDFLQQKRLNEARRLLLDTDMSLAEIASQTNFADATHLARTWKQTHGSTPATWRRANRENQPL